jgi:hypothetical protein
MSALSRSSFVGKCQWMALLEMSSTSAIAPWLSFPMPLSRMMLLDASRIRCLLCSPFVAM